ncbi:MAG TPA: two-component regulator propeller domain-containing protein [Chitinophagaceae bacterium]|nr:two-component regulator propeller domain-containing protein [Chitinophagaceae bacterium]
MKKLLLIVFLVVAIASYGQQGYTFNRISTDDALGLSSNSVYCTYQDKSGYIWVGTANGLQRFDGSKFISFGNSNPSAAQLPVSDLSQIIPGENEKLWLFFGPLLQIGIYDPVKFQYEIVPVKTSRPIPARSGMRLWKDSKNNMYLSIWKYGILRYNKEQKTFSDENPFRLPAGWISALNVFEDTVKRQIWFPCPDSGMAVFDIPSQKIYTNKYNPLHIPLLDKKEIMTGLTEFFIDTKRRYWVFNWTTGQFKRCYDERGNLLQDTAGINDNTEYSELTNFFESSQKVLWVYGSNGLFNYDNNSKRFYFYKPGTAGESGIAYHSANFIMEDRDGSIWISTDNGLFFTSPGSGTYNVVNILFDERKGGIEITDLIQLKTGEYWLSTWGKGILTLDKNFNSYSAGIYKNMPAMDQVNFAQYHQAWALYQHSDGKIWIGCQAGKYIIYDPSTQQSKFLELKEAEAATIRYITGDKNGTIWFSTQRGHVIKYNGSVFTRVQLFGTITPKILVDNMGKLWVPTFNQGLYCLSNDGNKIIRHYTSNSKEDPLFINSGDDIDQINDTTIAFGAGALHLINTNTGKITWKTFNDGLPGNTIQRIRADRDGNLWIITKNGLSKYNPRTDRFTPYGRKDGITLANLTTTSDFICNENYVMFAGANALMYFLPSMFDLKTSPPDVVITDFKLFNEYMPVDSLLALPELRFGSDQNSFTIFFSSLSYSQKEKLTYYYKMDGIDKEWIRADRQNFVNYPLLPPGHYTFSIYCENIDGIRSKKITSFKLYIRPPFWKTYWFISSLLFILLLFIYTLHRLRVNKLLAVEKIRNRVARDLHDDMGSTLSTINILSTMAKSKLNTDSVKTSEYISKISENSQRMMEAMDDIVWSIKPMNDSMQKIVARMREYATSILEAKEMGVSFNIEEDVNDVKLDMEARRDFFLVFKEAVNNAAKYSKAEIVNISLVILHHQLILEVSDNGKGFDKATADSGNGLSNMQKRADAMGGKLQIKTIKGEGTTVKLAIPFT